MRRSTLKVVAAIRPRPSFFVDAAAAAPSNGSQRRFAGLTRTQRVALLLAIVWMTGSIDLYLTLQETRSTGDFEELNPVAAHVLAGPAGGVIAYKYSLLGLGTVILCTFRRLAMVETSCWLLLAVKAYLMVRWQAYFYLMNHDSMAAVMDGVWTGS